MTEWRGNLDGYLAWAAENYKPNSNFCARHWAPCPVEGKNGLVATLLLVQEAIEQMPDEIADPNNPAAMNAWMEAQTEPTCCRLGDAKMAEIWKEADAA